MSPFISKYSKQKADFDLLKIFTFLLSCFPNSFTLTGIRFDIVLNEE